MWSAFKETVTMAAAAFGGIVIAMSVCISLYVLAYIAWAVVTH